MNVSRHECSAARRGASGNGGFTLIEMMITIVILAVLLTMAVPSFRDSVLGGRLSAVANNLLASVQLARSEAIKRNAVITLCASADGVTCALSGGWEQGWVVLNGAVPLQVQQALPTGLKLTQSGGTSALSFQPIGVGATAAVFTACRSAPVGNQERVVTVSATGVAYVTRTTTGSCP